MDTIEQAIKNQAEIKSKIADIQTQIERHQRVEVLNSMIDTAAEDVSKLSVDVQALKESVADMASQKAAAVRSVSRAVVSRMSKILPSGKAIIDIRDDDSVFIGWNNGAHIVPYQGLSGGQKVVFDMALSSALLPEKSQKILVVEAGELDDENLKLLLERISDTCPEDAQILVNTCHGAETVPDGWKVFQV